MQCWLLLFNYVILETLSLAENIADNHFIDIMPWLS